MAGATGEEVLEGVALKDEAWFQVDDEESTDPNEYGESMPIRHFHSLRRP